MTNPFDGKTYKNFKHLNLHLPRWQKFWPNFTPEEIACKGTGKLLVNAFALSSLQDLRDMLDAPIALNSAYRSPQHNRAVGGAPNSKHMDCIAFDVQMRGHDPHQFEAAARECGFKGFGFYMGRGESNFMHIDLRDTPAMWASNGPGQPMYRVAKNPFPGGFEDDPNPIGSQDVEEIRNRVNKRLLSMRRRRRLG